MQTNDSLVLCLHCWGGLGWKLIGGVNISNASPEYLQPYRVISGSCNYPPGYLPSDPHQWTVYRHVLVVGLVCSGT